MIERFAKSTFRLDTKSRPFICDIDLDVTRKIHRFNQTMSDESRRP